jgi:hypothetical protein
MMYIKLSQEYGQNAVVVNTLSDGQQFGELSIISTLKNEGVDIKRAATCQAGETTDMLLVPKIDYHQILIN